MLLPAFRHSKAIEHLRGGTKSDDLAFLANGQCGKKDENQTVLPEWQTELRMPRDLEEEVSVPPLEEKLVTRRFVDGEIAKDEWA